VVLDPNRLRVRGFGLFMEEIKQGEVAVRDDAAQWLKAMKARDGRMSLELFDTEEGVVIAGLFYNMYNLFGRRNVSVNGYLWGLYHWQQQPYGRGDGSDGAADNRLCLATPGYPHSKAPTVNQDLQNVSVRGLAWLAWNRVDAAPPPTTGGTYRKLLLCVLARRPG
jgi:hypothetical protein